MVTLHAFIFCEVALMACWMSDESGSLGTGLLQGRRACTAGQTEVTTWPVSDQTDGLGQQACPTHTHLLAMAKQVSRRNISSL